MANLTQQQVDAVVDWINEWEWLRDTSVPLRFKEDWGSGCIRPPLGLMPKKIHDLQRKENIINALKRYSDAGKPPPKEWVVELALYCE